MFYGPLDFVSSPPQRGGCPTQKLDDLNTPKSHNP
jgi:hypothetical protein